MTLILLSMAAALAAAPKASSTLTADGQKMTADLAFDGLLGTGWAEGADGAGEGSWLELDLGRKTPIQTLTFWPGDLSQGAKSYREHGRPTIVRLQLDGVDHGTPIVLEDRMQRVDVDVNSAARRVRLVVDESKEGIVFNDLYIAEVALDYAEHVNEGRLDAWKASPAAKSAATTFYTALDEAYATHKDSEFGDRDAFAVITDAVSDGPPFIRKPVRDRVPIGYRAQAVESSKRAQKALRKLKDPNGIGALEMAALRASDDEAAALAEMVEIFYAYQELIGGGSRNIKNWGQPGWEPGALRGYGEPLALDIDADGNVYVADTGNNRIQRFNPEGRMKRSWGGAPDLASAWFQRGRPWYVSGAGAGEGAGEWTNPLDVEIIPGKDQDSWAAIDAKGRVQVFDPEGRQLISWTVDTPRSPEPGLGGQGYLVWVPKRDVLVAVIQNEAVAYTLDSEEVARFKIEDGAPNGAEVDKAGRLLLIFGREVIAYNLDGFRYGTVINDDLLDPGFENMDIARDEENKLWIATDTGWVYKFKKPGKLDFKIRVADFPVEQPRVAVREGMLFLTANDRIEAVDIRQLRLDEAQALKDAAEAAAAGDE